MWWLVCEYCRRRKYRRIVIELAALEFLVKTDQLKNARNELVELRAAYASVAAAHEQSSKKIVANENAKSRVETQAARERKKSLEVSAGTSDKSISKAQDDLAESTNKASAILQRQADILAFVTQGFSKGQSSVLAYAKAAGATEQMIKSLGDTLQSTRSLIGGDPFDKSLGGLKALRNEYSVARSVIKSYNNEQGLTRKQAEALARDKLRLLEQYKAEVITFEQLKSGFRSLNLETVSLAAATNKVTAGFKDQEKGVKTAAAALQRMTNDLDRVNQAQRFVNEGLDHTTAVSLANFQRNLAKTGLSLDAQKRKLEEYKQGLTGFNKNTTASGRSRDGYIGAAIAPQITDIFTSLQAGQSPLTVILQQGGQLRDLFQQMGVAGEDMAMRIRNAIVQMPSSIAAIAGAMTRVAVELPFMMAKGFANMVMNVTLLNSAFDGLIGQAPALVQALNGVGVQSKILSAATATVDFAIKALRASVVAFVATGAVLLVTTLAAVAIEAFKVMKASTELDRALLQSGASLGLNKTQAIELARAFDATGKSSSYILQAFTEFAKAGGVSRANLEAFTLAAVNMQKYVGVALEETAKDFKEMSDEPSKALGKLASDTGLVSAATLVMVQRLENAGMKAQAAALAQEEYRKVLVNISDEAKTNLTPLERGWINIKDAINVAAKGLVDFGNVSIDKVLTAVKYLQTDLPKVATMLQNIGGIFASISTLLIPDAVKNYFKDGIKDGVASGVQETQKRYGNLPASQMAAELGLPDTVYVNVDINVKEGAVAKVQSAVNLRALENSMKMPDGSTLDSDFKANEARRSKNITAANEAYLKTLKEVPKALTEVTKAQETLNNVRKTSRGTAADLEAEKNATVALAQAKKDLVEAQKAERGRAKANAEERFNAKITKFPRTSDFSTEDYEAVKKKYEQEISLVEKLEKNKLDLLKVSYEQDNLNYAQYSQQRISAIQAASTSELNLLSKQLTAQQTEYDKLTKAKETAAQNERNAINTSGFATDDRVKKLQEFNRSYSKEMESLKNDHIANVQAINDKKIVVEAKGFVEAQAVIAEYGKALKSAQNSLAEYNLEEQERIRVASEATSRQLALTFATEREAVVLNAVNKARDEYNSEIKKQIIEVEKASKALQDLANISGDQQTEQESLAYRAWLLQKEKLDKIYLDRKSAAERSAIDAVLLYEAQERNKMLDSVANVLVTALTKGGREGAKSLRAWLEQELTKELTISIKAQVTQFLGADGKGGLGGLLQSLIGKVSERGENGDTVQGSGILGKLGDLIPSLKGVFSALPGAISAGFQGAGIGAAISGGFEVFKGSGQGLGAVGGIIGSIFGGPIGAIIGSTIGGLINRAFGRKLENTGIQGTARGTGSVDAQKFEFLKGGWFRSDKTNLSAVDTETQKALEDTIGAITDKLKEYSKILGVSSEALANFSYQFKIDTKDLSADQIQKKFQDMFSDFTSKAAGSIFQNTEFQEYAAKAKGSVDDILKYLGDLAAAYSTLKNQGSLIQDVIGEMLSIKDLDSLKNEGEGLTATLQRLLGVFSVTNLIATTLGKDASTAFGAVGKASYAARENLVALAGSVEQLGSSVNFFLDNFYSQAEKDAFLKTQAQNTLSTGFAGLARAIPSTREEFRALVEGVDLTTEEGRKLYVELLRLAPAMFEVTKSVTTAINSINGLSGLTSSAISSLFEEVLAVATSRQEAETLAAGKAEGLFYDSLMQSIIGAATDAIMTAVIEPMSSSLLISSTNAGQSLTVGASAAGSALTAGGFSASAALVGVVTLVRNITGIMRSPEYISAMKEFILTIKTVSGELYDSSLNFRDAATAIQEAAPSNSTNVGSVLNYVGSFIDNLTNGLQKAYDILKKAVEVDKKIIEARLKSLEELSKVNKAAVESLLLAGESSKGAVYTVARAELEAAFETIRQGLLPDVAVYQENLSRVMEGINDATYASRFEEDRARLTLAAELTNIESLITPQKTVAEQQLSTLNALLSNAEAQLAALSQNAEADYSVAQAVANWNRVVESTLAGWAWLESQYWWATPDAPSLRPLTAPAAPLPLPQAAPVGDWGYGGGGGGDTGFADAMAVLTSEVQMLRAEVRADVEANTKTSQILSRVSQDGETLSVAPSY